MLSVVLEEIPVLLLSDVDAAAAAADDHAGVRLGKRQARVVPRFARREDAEQRRARVAPGIGARLAWAELAVDRHRRRDVDRRHRCRDFAGVGGGVDLADRAGAAPAAADRVPKRLAAGAESRDDSDSGDGNARMGHERPPYNSQRDTALPLERRATVPIIAALLRPRVRLAAAHTRPAVG